MPCTSKSEMSPPHSFLKASPLTYYRQPATAWALKKAWPEITLHVVPDAGHSSRELGITKLLVEVKTATVPLHSE